MFWRGLRIAGVVLAGLGAGGCFNSEADYQALLEENNALSAELDEVRNENEILTRALADINREQETLQLLLSAGKSNLNAGRVNPPPVALAAGEDQAADIAPAPAADSTPAPAAAGGNEEWQTPAPPAAPAEALAAAPAVDTVQAPAPARSSRYYVTKPGDVLSYIARANQTTVAKLLELNPNLRNRRDYMIYENERLRLP
jgi:LysM repeat protein